MGSGLTTVDIVATLVRRGHKANILAISRRGLRSKPLGPPAPGRRVTPFDRINDPPPYFLPPPGDRSGTMGILRGLRAQIREVEAAGGNWRAPFDDLRDSVWQLWPALPKEQKRIFLRHLKPFYDIHRFRTPPQSGRVMDQAIAQGLLRVRAAKPVSAEAEDGGIRVGIKGRGSDVVRREVYDWVIDCTGLEASPERSGNRFLFSLMEEGLARPHPLGIGFDVDGNCHPLGADGRENERLFIVGPPTAGAFGAPIGATFIAFQISRIAPTALERLGL